MTKHLLSLSSTSWCFANGDGNSRKNCDQTYLRWPYTCNIWGFSCMLKMFQELDNELQHSFYRDTVVSAYNMVFRNQDFWRHRNSQHNCFTGCPICKIALLHLESLAVLSKDICIKIHGIRIFCPCLQAVCLCSTCSIRKTVPNYIEETKLYGFLSITEMPGPMHKWNTIFLVSGVLQSMCTVSVFSPRRSE